jgi:hypothetical protein
MADVKKNCPYLGMAHDPETKTSFASVMNCCHHARPVNVVELSFQGVYCLTGKYTTCPVFKREYLERLPKELRAPNDQITKKWIINQNTIFIILFLVVAIVFALWSLFFRNQLVIPQTGGQDLRQAEFAPSLPTATITTTQTPVPLPSPTTFVFAAQNESPEMTSTITLTSTRTPTKTRTPTPTKTLTPKPTLTKTLTITPTQTQTRTPTIDITKLGLDTIIGKDYPFIIHRVQTGESLSQYATLYKTSAGAILRVNYALNIPMWIDALVVIPVGFSDVEKMPYFQPYRIKTSGITVEVLAKELGTDLKEFIFYNSFTNGEKLKLGIWVLIPRLKR